MRIITLCGSTKFKKEFEECNRKLTLQNNIVISLALFSHTDGYVLNETEKQILNESHLRKIDISDEIFVINVDGYIGEGTKREIEYAKSKGKIINYLSSIKCRMKKVFLGGTCNESLWRNDLIKKLDINYFNPVVENWTEECMPEEIKQRENCDFVLYTITPKMSGFYNIAEVIDYSNKRPQKTLFCLIDEDDGEVFTEDQLKSLKQVAKMVKRNGGKTFSSLHSVAQYLNIAVINNHKQSEITGLKLLDYDNLFYPQYKDKFDKSAVKYKLDKTIPKDVWDDIQKQAKEKKEEVDKDYNQYLINKEQYDIDIAKFIEKYPDFHENRDHYERVCYGTRTEWDEYHNKEKEGFEFAPSEPCKPLNEDSPVYRHWVAIINGAIPFGYRITEGE